MTSTASNVSRIVVGVDGSEESKDALRWARQIAEPQRATLDAIAAWETSADDAADTDGHNPEGDVEKSLAETVDEVFGAGAPAGMRLSVLEGDAARVLLAASEGALMLVVGSRGHGGYMGLLLGSVSAKVAEQATCPVLVVHTAKRTETPPTTPADEAVASQSTQPL